MGVLAAVMFLVSFAWSSVYVGLPFYVERITRLQPGTTIAWTGWILGISSLVSMIASPLWARWAAHADARMAAVVLQVLQALGFLGAAFADSPLELFVARFLLGAVGATSTLLFLMAGRAPDPAERRQKLALIQSANTTGQIVAPLVGAVAAARLGFRLSFAFGGLVLVGCAALLQWGQPPADPSGPAATARRRRPVPVPLLVQTSAVALVGASQEAFLAAVLPQVLPGFGIDPDEVVHSAGLLIFLSGVAAADRRPRRPAARGRGPAAPPAARAPGRARRRSWSAFSFARSLWLYAVLRTAQSLCLAPLFPLLVARMSRHGEAIGILNAARSGGNFLGPVVATSLLAWGPSWTVYLLLGLAGLAAVPWTRR